MRLLTITRYLLFALLFLLLTSTAAAQDDTPELIVGQVEGQVKNLSAGATPPAEIPVVLYILQDISPVEILTGTVASGGGFVFQDVPLIKGNTYVATLNYQNVSYGSPFVTYDGLGKVIPLEVQVYEATSDPGAIVIGRLHILVDFGAESMFISEIYIVDNLGDQVFVGPTGDPAGGTLELLLPAGIVGHSIAPGMGTEMAVAMDRFISIEGGYRDTLAVRPGAGSQQLSLTYELPYNGEATLSRTWLYPLKGASLLLPDAGLLVESDVLTSSGLRTMQGTSFAQWDAALAKPLSAGETLSFRISGEPDLSGWMMGGEMPGPVVPGSPNPHVAPSLTVAAGDNPTTWAVGAAALAMALVVVGLLGMRWRSRAGAMHSRRDGLLQAIVDLDATHAAGEVPAGRYELEREQLKAELRGWYET